MLPLSLSLLPASSSISPSLPSGMLFAPFTFFALCGYLTYGSFTNVFSCRLCFPCCVCCGPHCVALRAVPLSTFLVILLLCLFLVVPRADLPSLCALVLWTSGQDSAIFIGCCSVLVCTFHCVSITVSYSPSWMVYTLHCFSFATSIVWPLCIACSLSQSVFFPLFLS